MELTIFLKFYNYMQLFTCYARSNLTKVIQKMISFIWFIINFSNHVSLEKGLSYVSHSKLGGELQKGKWAMEALCLSAS